MEGYKNAKKFAEHKLPVSDLHTLSIEEWGNPEGIPVIFIHGGPGGMVTKMSTIFFNPEKYRIILYDQRGCGKSTPFNELKENTFPELIDDLEKIRLHLNIPKWHLFGGSFGTTLAIAYAIKYPDRVKGMILRGIFLGRDEDIQWLYQDGAGYFFPEVFAEFRDYISKDKQDDLISAYYKIFTSDDVKEKEKACKIWSNWEDSIVNLIPEPLSDEIFPVNLTLATLECHYFANHMFWDDDNFILNNIEKIQHIPMKIVHGRYDVDCRPLGAYELAQKHKNCNLYIVDASGHSPYQPLMLKKLIEITDNLDIN